MTQIALKILRSSVAACGRSEWNRTARRYVSQLAVLANAAFHYPLASVHGFLDDFANAWSGGGVEFSHFDTSLCCLT
jgi:hypothetical protein